MLRMVVGELVVRSNSTLPRDMPCNSPLAPTVTSVNSAGPGSDVKTICAAAPTARARRDVRRDRLGTNVVHVHLVTGIAQARRHAPAHRPETNESDSHVAPR